MSPTLPFASRLRPSLEHTGDTITIERLPVDEGGLIVASRRTDGELVCVHPVPDGLTPADWAASIAAEYPSWTVISEHVADDSFHLAYIPLGGPVRPQCPGSGPTTMRHDDVTCPDCLAVIAKNRARAEAAEAAAQHDAHAVDDGPDAPPSAWMDREPVEDPEPHRVYVTEAGVILVAVGPPNLVTLYDAEGNTFWPQDVRPLRPAATIPADLAEALEIEKALESLTGIRRVPADAIVLPATDPEGEALLQDAGYVIDPANANRIVGIKGRRIELLTGHCDHCGDQAVTEFSPGAARRLAALLAMAADEAEREQR